jgi:hypothetical protein
MLGLVQSERHPPQSDGLARVLPVFIRLVQRSRTARGRVRSAPLAWFKCRVGLSLGARSPRVLVVSCVWGRLVRACEMRESFLSACYARFYLFRLSGLDHCVFM